MALIAAAGGLVWRPDRGRRAVCLVHRPRYDDWSLPKGSVKRGEHPVAAAVREVAEETGLRGVPQLPLPPTRYEVGGVPKVVEYWAMSTTGEQQFQPSSEVDGTAWLPVPEAVRRVRYPHDAELLLSWDGQPAITAVVLLVRHAHAGKRSAWPGPDPARPLSARGLAEAATLCMVLELFAPTRLVSATPDRCRQTVAPLAVAGNLPVELDPVFDETAGEPGAATERVGQLAAAGGVTVVCTQGALFAPLLSRRSGAVAAEPGGGAGRQPDWATSKGDGWLLSFAGPHVLAVAPLRALRAHR